MADVAITLEQMRQAVAREIGLRERVYPRWVSAKKMSQEKADHELAAMGAVQRTLAGLDAWVPVTERLPDDGITVLVALHSDDEPVWLGWYDEGQWHSVDAGTLGNKVTHWKPIPQGPA